MKYKNHQAVIEFDADDGIFVGRLAGIRDGVSFHADTVSDLRAAFEEAVDDYIAACAKVGKEPQKPYSGKLMLRVSPEVHANSVLAAELSGLSLNSWSERVLREAARERTAA